MNGVHPRERGFTLIEIAIALFIIGLVMSGIVALVNATVANRQIETTKAKEEAIKTALISFIARNYRMPCPALGTISEFPVPPAVIPPSNNGVEGTTPGTCTDIPSSGSGANTVVTGVVPWVTLGLPLETSLDAYGNRFTYQVVQSATGLTSTTISGMTGRITIHSAGPGVLGATPTGNQINDCSTSGATVNPCAGVVAIVSHGKDGYGAYTRSGSQIPFDPNITGNDAKENANGDSMFVVKDYSETSTNPFDDIVMVLTTNDLLAPLLVAGTLKDYRATLNNTFQIMLATAIAYGVDNRSGGSGNRSYPLPNSSIFSGLLSSSQISDPWGTPIVYLRNVSSIDAGSNSSDVAITLTSYGPDKVSGDSDDVVQKIYVSDLQNIFQLSGW